MNQLPVSAPSQPQTHIFRRALPYVILLLLPLLIFAPVTLGRNTLLPADALYTSEPFRSAAPPPGIERPHNPLLSDLVLENYLWQRFIVESVRAFGGDIVADEAHDDEPAAGFEGGKVC